MITAPDTNLDSNCGGDRDYRYKRSQYQARGIAEYWIVDPITQRVTVLPLVEGLYEEAVFEGDIAIDSPLLEELLDSGMPTAAQVLQVSQPS
ncbi:MAG: Uma2 family endonuclease [Leptolyngbya sp.]|nr:Uma2 family endonuclease [Leptolyngbya sp.]